MSVRPVIRFSGFLLSLCLALAALPALACGVCLTRPERTVVDRLLDDALVVVARPDPAQPFRFMVAEVLRGDPAVLETAGAPGFLVDSALRRSVADGAAGEVLMSFGPVETEAGAEGGLPGRFGGRPAPVERAWHRLIALEPGRRALVDEVLTRGRGWGAPGTPGAEDRFDWFSRRHADPDPAVRMMALRELEKWPYDRLRQLRPEPDARALLAKVFDINGIPEAPLHILMLGLSDDPAADAIVRAQAASVMASGSDRLAPWATALLERDGAAGLAALEEGVLRRGGSTPEALSAAVQAIGTVASVRPDLRAEAARSLRDLGTRRPDLLDEVAQVLLPWKDWSLAPQAAARLDGPAELAPDERFALTFYALAAARETGN